MKILVFSLVSVLAVANVRAQKIDTTMERYLRDYGQERMYLHYDKPAYGAGETIWFKAYLMKTIFPADESKTVYVDWSDQDGKLLSRSICAVEDATTYGQFDIPRDYSGSSIHVRAYTKWMLNFDPAFLYDQDIRILGRANGSGGSRTELVPELNFFPEGGDAVAGVTNKIAFKANDQYGRPIEIKGVVRQNNGRLIDSLRILHDGMGYFFIIPSPGDTFSAFWEDQEGRQHTTPLPPVAHTGVALRVTLAEGARNFSVSAPSSFSASADPVHIVGTMYQQKIFSLDEQLGDSAVQGTIPTGSLPTGMLTITVFDSRWRPLAERITYINNEEYFFKPEISLAHPDFQKRGKNEISLSVPGGVSSSLSISVTDAGMANADADNIISHLLLTGELKGYVHDPGYYFLNNSDSIAEHLDLVMLTHGWRRFDWEKITRGQYPAILYPRDTSYLCLSGKVSGLTPAQIQHAGDIILMLSQDSSGNQAFTIPVQPDGFFQDPSFLLFDTARIFYNFSNLGGLRNVPVQFMPGIQPPFLQDAGAAQKYPLRPDSPGDGYQLQLNEETANELKYLKGKVLAAVKVKARLRTQTQEVNDKYTSGLFKSGNATELDLADDPLAVSYTDIVSYIQGKVPGLSFDQVAHKFLWLRNRSGENGPTLYLNEMGTSYDVINQIPVANVAYIKVFRPGFVGGAGSGTGGAIVIYTRMGGDQKTTNAKGLENELVSGYSVVRQFYSPDYGKEEPPGPAKDLRTTLYWNPVVTLTPGQDTATIVFYNNDVTGSFRIVMEGMAADGRLTHAEEIIR